MKTSEALYTQAYSTLRDAAFQAQPALTIDNVETLLSAVVRLLDKYPGADDLGTFTQWAVSEIIQPGAALLFALNTLTGDHVESLRKGIRSVLRQCDDLGVIQPGKTLGTIGELEVQAWINILIDLDGWLTPGYAKSGGRKPAKLTTRLYGHGRAQARGWRTSRLRDRENFGSLQEAEYRGAAGNRKPTLNEIEQRAV